MDSLKRRPITRKPAQEPASISPSSKRLEEQPLEQNGKHSSESNHMELIQVMQPQGKQLLQWISSGKPEKLAPLGKKKKVDLSAQIHIKENAMETVQTHMGHPLGYIFVQKSLPPEGGEKQGNE